MATKNDEVLIQLATRIPKALHREIKLHCVSSDISVMDFVALALEDMLLRKPQAAKRRAAAR